SGSSTNCRRLEGMAGQDQEVSGAGSVASPTAEDYVARWSGRVAETTSAATGPWPEAGGDGPCRGRACEKAQIASREAMFTEGAIGAAGRIQLPAQRVTRLRGVMIDVDPGKLLPENPLFPPSHDPREFFRINQAVLDRHPLARD